MKSPQKENLSGVYDRISYLVDEHILSKGVQQNVYQKDSYQIYIAACLCINNSPSIC